MCSWIGWGSYFCKMLKTRTGRGVCGICMCLFLPGTLWCLASVVVLHLNDAWIVHGFGPPTVVSCTSFSFLLIQDWLTARPRLVLSSTLTGLYTEPCTQAGRITDRQVDRRTWRKWSSYTLHHTYTHFVPHAHTHTHTLGYNFALRLKWPVGYW